MTTETMTVHEALCEIKTMDSRIMNAVEDVCGCTYKKHSAINIDGIAPATYIDQAKSKYQKATDLIARADAIKRAVSQSNASTKLVVAGKTMTVAEAIYEMQHGIDSKRMLLSQLSNQLRSTKDKIRRENEVNLESKVENYIRDNFGNKEKADPKALEEARRIFVENNTFEFIDPIGIEKEIERLRSEIDSFTTAVDSAIQISNSQTLITIEY